MGHLDRSFAWLHGDALPQADLVIDADAFDIDLDDVLGNPSEVREYIVWIKDAVVGATSTANTAFRTGALPTDSTVKIIGIGSARIEGAGGAGGRGEIQGSSRNSLAGGGGGGAGISAGLQGGSIPPAGPGSPGTANAGGSGGSGALVHFLSVPTVAVAGSGGGTALEMNVAVTIQDMQIFGGGGGGGGGGSSAGSPGVGGNGGNPGQAGSAGTAAGGTPGAGGAAGTAIIRNGFTLTQLGTNTIQGAIT